MWIWKETEPGSFPAINEREAMTDKEKQIQALYYLETCTEPQDGYGASKDCDVVSALATAAHYLVQSMFDGPKPDNYDHIIELAEAHIALDAARERVYLAEIKLGIDEV